MLEYYCTRNDLELVAVCDSRLCQAQALAENTGMHPCRTMQAMLLAVKPDVGRVSLSRFHYGTLMALEAGCHVMCEKPPAMTPEQARGNVRYRAQTGQGAGLRLSPSFCARYATAA